MPPRENDDVCLLETERYPGHISMEQAAQLKSRPETRAPVGPANVDKVTEPEPEPVPTPWGLLQYILCMFVNFIVILLGINWFLGFFGLALKPLEDLGNTKEIVQKLKEKKRKLEEIEKLCGIDESQQKFTKRPKPEEVLDQEKDTAETEEEERGIFKTTVGHEKAKAIAEFQNRLWNMKPDLDFLKKKQHSEAEVKVEDEEDESEYKVVQVEYSKCSAQTIGGKGKGDPKDTFKKVITPSESFDNVLNMSEDAGDDVVDIAVGEDDGRPVDANHGDAVDTISEQYEECRVEDQKEAAFAAAPPLIGVDLESDHTNVDEDLDDLGTEPTDTPVETEFNAETSPPCVQKIEEFHSSKTPNFIEEGQISEKEGFANDIDPGAVPSEFDYPVLVKPDYAVQVKPDYPLQEKPDYALLEKPDYAIQEKPDYAIQEKPDYQVQFKPDYPVKEKPTYEVIEKPIYLVQEKPDYAILEKPDYPLQEKPDYAILEKPDYQVQFKPDYPVKVKPTDEPIYQVQEKPNYLVKEKLDYPILEKPNCQAQEKPYCEVLDSQAEKQDDLELESKNNGPVTEDEKSEGNMTQIRTAKEQTENNDSAPEDNEKYKTLEVKSCEGTVESVGQVKAVTEKGVECEKFDEILPQLCTAEEQTEEENSAAQDNQRGDNPVVEVCEEIISGDVEEEQPEVTEKEGRRGSVGSKGRGGGNKSGSKQKKKKRKIL